MNPTKFFAEVKRRNVYKVAIAYGAVAWLLTEVATQVFPFFEIPNWVVRLVVLVIIAGFPIAVVIAWAFELTPEGLKRTEIADAKYPLGRSPKRAWIYIVIIAGAISVGIFFLGRYTSPKQREANELPGKSIGVLPFVDLSQAKDQEYFCDGISEEILDALAKVDGLRVVARTSSFSFKGKNADVAQIAQKLNVENVLEGSLRREGNRIRIKAQLINARNGFHIWSETFELELKGVFSVQDEITRSIVDALKVKLAVALPLHKTPSTEAYQLYLRGRYFWDKRTTEGMDNARKCFVQASERDPNYALAYAGL